MHFATDEQIGKYRIVGELGHGGMGVVYLAVDTNLDRQIALKFLQHSLSEDTAFKDRFRSEAKLISRIVHPNIVQIHSLDDVDGYLMIDMEYVEGQSLSHLMNTGPLSTSLTSHIALDVLQGLSVCHESGILHRDIKPSNILLSLGGQGKIVDFGIATALADRTSEAIARSESTMIFMGTPRYTPPEAWDEHPADPRWDVYALGVMLHEALTGQVAYQSRTMLSLMNEIVNSPLPPIETRIEGISPRLAEVLNAMVDPVPAHRIESAREAMKRINETQEAKSYSPYEAHTITRTVPRALRKSLRTSPAWDNRATRSVAGVVFAALLLTIVISSLVMLSSIGTSSAPSSSGDTPAITGSGIVDPEDLVEPLIWTARAVGDGADSEWNLYLEEAADGIATLFGYNELGLIQFDLTETSPGQFSIEGSWAEFTSPLGGAFKSGRLSGHAMRHDVQTGFTLSATFMGDTDRVRRDETFYLSPNEDIMNLTEFVRKIESSRYLPTLLDHEIRSRRLSLGDEADRLFPSSPLQRVTVPPITEESSPQIDGLLDDEVWTRTFFGNRGRIGDLPSAYGTGMTPMRFRHDDEALLLGFSIPLTDEHSGNLEIALRQIVEKPLANSRVTVLKADSSGNLDLRQFVEESEVKLTTQWTAESSHSGGVWSMEIRIPFEQEYRRMMETGIQSALRLVCTAVVDGEPVVYWGASSVDDIHHGAQLYIESTPN